MRPLTRTPLGLRELEPLKLTGGPAGPRAVDFGDFFTKEGARRPLGHQGISTQVRALVRGWQLFLPRLLSAHGGTAATPPRGLPKRSTLCITEATSHLHSRHLEWRHARGSARLLWLLLPAGRSSRPAGLRVTVPGRETPLRMHRCPGPTGVGVTMVGHRGCGVNIKVPCLPGAGDHTGDCVSKTKPDT